jgi:AcrR family transcriptional regulator
VVDAAIETFGTAGFDASVRAIAAAAGVGPGLVMHHFGSKDGLRAACAEHVLRVIREAETEAFTRSGPGALLAQLAELDRCAPLVGYLVQYRADRGSPAGPLHRPWSSVLA